MRILQAQINESEVFGIQTLPPRQPPYYKSMITTEAATTSLYSTSNFQLSWRWGNR